MRVLYASPQRWGLICCYCVLPGLLLASHAMPENSGSAVHRIRHSHLHPHERQLGRREAKAKPLINPEQDPAIDHNNGHKERSERPRSSYDSSSLPTGGHDMDYRSYRAPSNSDNNGDANLGGSTVGQVLSAPSGKSDRREFSSGDIASSSNSNTLSGGSPLSLEHDVAGEVPRPIQSKFAVAEPSWPTADVNRPISAASGLHDGPPSSLPLSPHSAATASEVVGGSHHHHHGGAGGAGPAAGTGEHGNLSHTMLFGTPISPIGHQVAWCHDESTDHEHAGGVSVASIRWEFVSVPFMFTAFVILAGLTKIVFHHANFLSSIIPESCMLILLGTLVGGIAHLTNNDTLPAFSPDTFFLYLLPPIVLESSYSLYDGAFFSNIGTILLYAVVGTLINVFTIGSSLFVLDQIGWLGGLDLGLLECLVFSSLISAVDPVAVLAIFQEVGVNKVLYFLVFGESLLNDAVTVVVYNMMVSFHGSEVTTEALLTGIASFFSVSVGAVAIGCVFGCVTALVTRYTNEVRVVEPLAVIGLAYMAYLTAELVHFSGIIAIICCGLVQVQYAMNNISQKSYTTVKYFTKMMSAVCDTIIFIFLGMVLVNKKPEFRTEFIMWTTVLCLVFRFMSVFGLTYCVNTAGRVLKINLEEQFIMAYGGLRGAVSFSLVIMLSPCKFPHYDVFVTTTLFIIIFTVFIQGASVKPLVNQLKIRRHQNHGDSLFTEINKKLVDNIMLGIEEVTGNRGGNYWKGVLCSLDEKYLRPLLVRDNGQNSLTRIYTKVVLADHYAHLYGPATALEEKLPLNVPRSLGEGALSLAAEDPISMTVPDDEGPEASSSEDEDQVLLRRGSRKKSVTMAAHANVLMPRLTMSCNDAEQLRAASRSLDSETSNNNQPPMSMFAGPPGVALAGATDVGALSSDEKRRYTVGLWRKAVARASSLDSRPKADTAKLLLRALNENPYHKYHQRYNPNLVDDDNQELAAHLRARRLRARRLTMYTLAGDMPSEPEQTDQDSLHNGSTSSPLPPAQGGILSTTTTAGAAAAAAAAAAGQGCCNTTDTESDNETRGRRRQSSQGERRRSVRQRRKVSTLTLGQVSHLDILRAAQQRRSSLMSRQSGSLSGQPTSTTTTTQAGAGSPSATTARPVSAASPGVNAAATASSSSSLHTAVEKADSVGKESVHSSRPPSLKLSRQKAISSSQEDVLNTPRSSSPPSALARATPGETVPMSGAPTGYTGGRQHQPQQQQQQQYAARFSGARSHSTEDDVGGTRGEHHVVNIGDVLTEEDKKDLEETSM